MVFVVIAHYKEDTEWTKNLKYKYKIISRQGIPFEKPPNRGNEASSYLEYIIENYHNLDDITIFVHAHRSDWHHKENMDDKINRLHFNHAYFNINTNDEGNSLTDLNRFPTEQAKTIQYAPFFEKLLDLKIDPTKIMYRNSAQFYVTKETIQQYSRDVYIQMFMWLMKVPEHTYYTSRVFEYFWHIIFTRNHEDVK